MRRYLTQKALPLLLAGCLLLGLAACGGKAASDAPAGTVPTITFYPSAANLSSGVVGGYKGDYFASRGFALDVWAYSDEKTNAILASGDLPDVLFIPAQSLDTMIESGMLLNLDEYLDRMPHLQAYPPMETALNYIRRYKSAGTGGVYGLTTGVGEDFTACKTMDSTERNALKIRWEVYEEIGAPAIENTDDLLDVMAAMLAAHPTEADGSPAYGTVLNNGSDTNYWACMTMWYRMQGYQEIELPYLLECNMAAGTATSILAENSMYYRGLRWYNAAYRRGLLDPDSINNDRLVQMDKVKSGHTMVPSGYLAGWAPTYYEYLLPGTKVYYRSEQVYGDPRFMIGISAGTENLDACLAYLDMLCDPDAYLTVTSGPEGEFWQTDAAGNAFFTDAGLAHLKTAEMGDFTGFALADGEKLDLWNTPWVIGDGAATGYGDGKGGRRVARSTAWSENNAIGAGNESFHQWQKTTGHESWKEWLAAEDALVTDSPLSDIRNFESLPGESMQGTVNALCDTVTTASWRMVYAADDAEFDALWAAMTADCEGLGAQAVIDWRLADIEQAKQTRDSLMG